MTMMIDRVGFIDTPLGMGPATMLGSPVRISDLGARREALLEIGQAPLPMDQSGDTLDGLYQATMEQFYAIGKGGSIITTRSPGDQLGSEKKERVAAL